MNPQRSLLATCATALALAACSPAAPCCPGPWLGAHSLPPELPAIVDRYEPTPARWARLLHDACQRCASLEFTMDMPGEAQPFRRRVERAEAAAALEQILRVTQWYTRCNPPGLRYAPKGIQRIFFYDDQGTQLFKVGFAAAGEGYARVDERYLSLWELFASWLEPRG